MIDRTILACLLLALAQPVQAHDWYPMECCSGQDCAPVEKVEVTPVATAGIMSSAVPSIMVVTTKHGSAVVPPTMVRRPSEDARMHACIHAGRVLCIFVPPAM